MNLIVLFICNLFNYAFSVSHDYTASNKGIISEWWISRDLEGRGSGQISGTIPAFAWRDWGNPRKLGQDIWSPSRDVNPGPSEYEAEVLTSLPWRSVTDTEKFHFEGSVMGFPS
jgi:hypothetical protein